MNPAIQYGTITTIESDGAIDIIREVGFANFKPNTKKATYRETVRIDDDKDILTHFLRLLDAAKSGEISDIGLCVKTNEHNGTVRIEKTWTVEG